jgi:hypothetical protein
MRKYVGKDGEMQMLLWTGWRIDTHRSLPRGLPQRVKAIEISTPFLHSDVASLRITAS